MLSYYKTRESLNRQDENGDFALLYASLNKNASMVSALIEAGANPDLRNRYGTSALWYAAYNNDMATLKVLLPKIKNLDPRSTGINYNSFQWSPDFIYDIRLSPVEVAEREENYSIVYLLKCSGAKLNSYVIESLNAKLDFYKKSYELYLNGSLSSNSVENKRKLKWVIRDLVVLVRSLSQPLSLQRICRNQINTLKFKTSNEISSELYKKIQSNAPNHLKDFINFERD